MKRKLIIILVLAILAALLSACANRNNAQQDTQESQPPSAQADPAPTVTDPAPSVIADPATVSWIIICDGIPDHDIVMEEVNRLLLERHGELNLQLDLVRMGWGTYPELLPLMFLGGEEFDIVFLAQWYPPFFEPLAARGDLTPLDDLLAAHGADIRRIITDPRWFASLSHDGRIYGVPIAGNIASVAGITFHSYYMEKHGFDHTTVRTLTDLEPFLQAIADNEPHLIPLLPGFGARHLVPPRPGDFEAVDWGFLYDPATGTLHCSYLDETRTLPFWRLMYNWQRRGFIAMDAASRTIWGDEMESGQYAVMPNFGFLNDGISSSERLGFRANDVAIFTNQPLRGADIQNSLLGISRTSTQPDRAMQMINIVFGDPLIYNTLAYGVQGVHWNFIDEAGMMIDRTDAGRERYGHTSYFQLAGLPYLFGTPELPRAQIEVTIRANQESPMSSLMGFVFDPTNVETEAAAFNAIIAEVGSLLDTGTVNPDTFVPDLINRLNAAGRQTLYEELQRQLTAWKAAQ